MCVFVLQLLSLTHDQLGKEGLTAGAMKKFFTERDSLTYVVPIFSNLVNTTFSLAISSGTSIDYKSALHGNNTTQHSL